MSLYACVIIRENYVFLSLSANFSRYDIHHLNKATSPVPASLRWWTGSSGVSDLRTRCCLTSITGRLFIQWRLKLDGAHLRRMEILVVKLALGCLLPVTEAMAAWREAHCGFSNNSEPNGSFESTKFSSFNPVSSNKFLCVCRRAASRAWGNPLSVSEFTIAKTNICSCIQRCSSWPSCCLVRDKGSVKKSGTEEWRLCGLPLTQGK